MKFKSSQGNYNALEQDKMLKEHETHAMLNVISFFFYKTASFPSLPRSTWSCQSTTSDMSSHGRSGEVDPEAEPGWFMPPLDKGVK